jgi:hypothetical protein
MRLSWSDSESCSVHPSGSAGFCALSVAESGAGFGGDVGDFDRLAAVLAGEPGVGDLAAGVVAQHDRGAFGSCEVCVVPAHEGDDGGERVASGFGQPVLVAGRVVGALDALEQAGIDTPPVTRWRTTDRRPGPSRSAPAAGCGSLLVDSRGGGTL